MSPELESLLRDEGWVRALARRLVRDAAAADDLVQEAWLAARRRPPAERTSDGLRRWVASVLRNRARQDRRAEARREARERTSARPEAVGGAESSGGPGELLERLELRERVVRAVRELDEPYRTAILLRWFEGLAPREIARRRGVPRRTVHSWLARGLVLLRARLERELNDQDPLGGAHALLALLPLCARPGPPLALASPGSWIGAATMTLSTKLALAGALAACLAAAYLVTRRAEPAALEPRGALAAPAPAPAEPSLPAVAARAERPAGERVALASEPEPASEPPAAPDALEEAPRTLHGRLVDPADHPLAGLALLFRGEGEVLARTQSAGDGSFELACPVAGGRAGILVVDDPAWVSVLEPMLWGDCPESDPVVVAAPRLDLAGVVLDAAQQPIAEAEVRLRVDDGLRSRLSRILDSSQLREPSTRTDAQGRFTLSSLPQVEGSFLVVEHPGHQSSWVDAPESSRFDLQLVLAALEADTRLIEGRVVDGAGAPLSEGVHVALEGESVVPEADGRFRVLARGPGEEGVLWVVDGAHAPVRIARRGDSNLAEGAWPDPLLVVLEAAPRTIEGRVLRADGTPAAGARVSIPDTTPFGTVPLSGIEREMLLGASVEGLASGGLYNLDPVECDAEGRFAIGGLLEREYTLDVLEPATLAHLVARASGGQRGLELRLPALELSGRIAGRVVDPRGNPIEHARVSLQALRADGSESYLEGREIEVGADGRFDFGAVSDAVTHLYVAGPWLGTDRYVALEGLAREALELVVPRACHLQVVLADPAEADAFEVRDEEGRAMGLVVHHGSVAYGTSRHDLVEGRSEPVITNEHAAELVLYRAGNELRRLPLALVPGELNTIRP